MRVKIDHKCRDHLWLEECRTVGHNNFCAPSFPRFGEKSQRENVRKYLARFLENFIGILCAYSL